MALLPAQISAQVSCDSLYLHICLSNTGAKSLPCHRFEKSCSFFFFQFSQLFSCFLGWDYDFQASHMPDGTHLYLLKIFSLFFSYFMVPHVCNFIVFSFPPSVEILDVSLNDSI